MMKICAISFLLLTFLVLPASAQKAKALMAEKQHIVETCLRAAKEKKPQWTDEARIRACDCTYSVLMHELQFSTRPVSESDLAPLMSGDFAGEALKLEKSLQEGMPPPMVTMRNLPKCGPLFQ